MPLDTKSCLVTGAAGFIGSHTSRRLIDLGYRVTGFDNLNSYYDVNLKKDRLRSIEHPAFTFIAGDISDERVLSRVFDENGIRAVVHLAAQGGVRHSMDNPAEFVQSNLVGFANVLECCRRHAIEHLVFASSSSVYGANARMPFRETDPVDHPVSFYAATKKSNEILAHSYSDLYDLAVTGLRFFTVYGPWGRPDMAPMLFAEAITHGRPLKVFNEGRMQRDFTFIDDIVDGLVRTLESPPKPNPKWESFSPTPESSRAPYRIYNIGNGRPVELLRFIELLEACLGKKAEKILMPLQPGDVLATYASTSALEQAVGFRAKVSIEEGVSRFASWYRSYF